jgi:hypothetical protein
MYAEYSRNYEQSNNLLIKLIDTRKDFRQFLEVGSFSFLNVSHNIFSFQFWFSKQKRNIHIT